MQGDALAVLSHLADDSMDCCVTSPPYWGLRDYGVEGQIGLEETPAEFVAKLTEVFREVRRVLKASGTCWVNLGDSYAGSWGSQGRQGHGAVAGRSAVAARQIAAEAKKANRTGAIPEDSGLKPKDLCGIPWRVAFALQADGWYLRQDIIWHKPNPMPESVRGRCTKAHEYVFLLTKSARYFWDAAAMKEPVSGNAHLRGSGVNPKAKVPSGWDTSAGSHRHLVGRYPKAKQNTSFPAAVTDVVSDRNRRSVWTLATMPTPEAHFATFPIELPEMCIRAGCPEGGLVLDPFSGAGTTGLACLKNGRRYVGIELNPEYVAMANQRAARLFPLFAGAVTA
jgi:DNA modification methylase